MNKIIKFIFLINLVNHKKNKKITIKNSYIKNKNHLTQKINKKLNTNNNNNNNNNNKIK